MVLSSEDVITSFGRKSSLVIISMRNKLQLWRHFIYSVSALNYLNMNARRQKYIHAIETTTQEILLKTPPTIEVKNWLNDTNLQFTDRLRLVSDGDAKYRSISSADKKSRALFKAVLHFLYKVKIMLQTNTYYTRREIYYQEISVVRNRDLVDYALEVICVLLNGPPWELGIMASSKGLVAGALLIKNGEDDIVDCNIPGGTLIPYFISKPDTEMKTSARFVLLVEKDAIFQKLLVEGILTKIEGLLLVTGKGYPDVNTRILVKKLSDQLELPVLALMDADPHGICIMCVYRYGSVKMSNFARSLVTPAVRWLGVHSSELQNKKVAALKLTSHDKAKLRKLSKKEYISSNKDLLNEIKTMLRMGVKSEIEALCALNPNYLTEEYIPFKIRENQLY